VDGGEIGKTLIVFGRGTQRGDPVFARKPGPPRDGQGSSKLTELKGWGWGAFDSVQSWGTNIVTGLVDGGPGLGSLVYYDFNRQGLSEEGALSAGDSGGGVFIQSGSTWKLAGINYAVDGPWRIDLDRPEFNAAIFDAGGLYVGDPPQFIPDLSQDQPGS